MNKYQQTLYDDLMNLVEKSEAFYFADRQLDNKWYRIFNYRMASYTDFLAPNALEARGHMFEIDKEGPDAEVIRLAAIPPQKFFNVNENPFTMELDMNDVIGVDLKADGSLISTFIHPAPWSEHEAGDCDLYLKTKGSLESDQALAAMRWLNQNKKSKLKAELNGAEKLGCTVNLEWCAPDNRIVIGYEEPHLTVLNVRSREDGSYIDFRDIDADHFPEILNHWIELVDVEDPVQFSKDIPDMQGIEGYILKFPNMWVKQKTTWYLALHHTKDSINCPRRLFEAVLEEATDDMRSLFFDDVVALNMITEMELFVEKKYNHLVNATQRFMTRNKLLCRKDYAILGREELSKLEFGIAMQLYTNKEVDYKSIMKKQWKHYELTDEKEDS